MDPNVMQVDETYENSQPLIVQSDPRGCFSLQPYKSTIGIAKRVLSLIPCPVPTNPSHILSLCMLPLFSHLAVTN